MLVVALGGIEKSFHDLRKGHFERWILQLLDDYLIQEGTADLVTLNPGPWHHAVEDRIGPGDQHKQLRTLSQINLGVIRSPRK